MNLFYNKMKVDRYSNIGVIENKIQKNIQGKKLYSLKKQQMITNRKFFTFLGRNIKIGIKKAVDVPICRLKMTYLK